MERSLLRSLAVTLVVTVLSGFLVQTASAKPVSRNGETFLLSLGVNQDNAVAGTAWALLSIGSPRVEYGGALRITYQRVMQENVTKRVHDFVGLYLKDDPKVYDPWNWEAVPPRNESGVLALEANKAGDMELRLVRPPNKILASVPVKVFAPCNPLCFKHGTCVEGECICHAGYALPTCDSIDPSGVKLEAFDKNMGQQQQVSQPIIAKISHDHPHPIDMNGKDYVGVYPAGSPNGTAAVSWKFLPVGNTSILELPPVKIPGSYILRLTRHSDMTILVNSEPFTVYETCPHDCTRHGQCLEGRCRCETGFSGEDCSVGEGMVSLRVLVPEDTQVPRDSEVTVAFSRAYDSAFPNLMGDMDWIGMFAPMDNVTSSPFAYQYAQMDPDTAEAANQTGEVVFVIPPGSNAFVFKYVRNDQVVLATTSALRVLLPCPNNCSDRGSCHHGVCQCDDGWTGEACDKGDTEFALFISDDNVLTGKDLEITFERPVGLGSAHDFIGIYEFGNVHEDMIAQDNSKGLFGYAVTNESLPTAAGNGETGTTILVPTKPGSYTLRYVNAYSRHTKTETAPFQVYANCPKDCHSHGICYQGECRCDDGWLSPDCRRADGEVVLSAPTRVVLNGTITDKTNFTATVSKPEGWHMAGDFIGLYPVPLDPLTQLPVSAVLAFAPAPADAGSEPVPVSFSSAVAPGRYQLWYVRGSDFSKVATSDAFEVVPDCNINNGGFYDVDTHKCVCPDTKTGSRCEQDTCCYELAPSTTQGHPGQNLTVNWVRPNKNGRDSDLIALYLHNETSNFSAPYAFEFATGVEGGDEGAVTFRLPHVEETFTLHYVRTSDMTSQETGPNVYVTIPCDPADCSGHGVCMSGRCVCTSGFGGVACDKSVPDELSVEIESAEALTAGSVFNVRWARPADQGEHGDYLAIFKRLDSGNPFGYAFVPIDKETFEGTLQLNAPGEAGTFQVRWISAKTKQPLVSSTEFDVTA